MSENFLLDFVYFGRYSVNLPDRFYSKHSAEPATGQTNAPWNPITAIPSSDANNFDSLHEDVIGKSQISPI